MISSGKFCDAADTNEDIRNLIPCWIIYDTCLWQFKHFLEDFDRIGSLFTIDTVCIDLWNQRVSIGDRVKLFLHLAHLASGTSDCQVSAGPGCRNTGYFFGRININIVTIEALQDF